MISITSGVDSVDADSNYGRERTVLEVIRRSRRIRTGSSRIFLEDSGRKAVEDARGVGFDVLVMRDFPDSRLSTYFTCGLSFYILDAPGNEGVLRQELAWTLHGDHDNHAIANTLFHLGERILADRVGVSSGDLWRNIPLSKFIPAASSNLSTIMFSLGVWLSKDERLIENYIPCIVVEIAALTASETKSIEADRNAFLAKCESGGECPPMR
jgi:hypothetical protein